MIRPISQLRSQRESQPCRPAVRETNPPGHAGNLRSPRLDRRSARGAFLTTELVVAMAILLLAVFPVSYALMHERQLSRACYDRAVAMEIVDGEMEVLAAGAWRAFDEGSNPFPVRAESAKNLPPGHFVLTRTGKLLRLEWRPERRERGGRVSREFTLP